MTKKIEAQEMINHLKDHNSDKLENSGVFKRYEESYEWDGGFFDRYLEDYPNGHPLSPFKDDGDMKLFKDD